jgi:hypothetical protein
MFGAALAKAHPISSNGRIMTFANDAVDPEILQSLLKAFNLARDHIARRPHEFPLPEETVVEELTVIISDLAKSGERNPTRLAEIAIHHIRKLHRPT